MARVISGATVDPGVEGRGSCIEAHRGRVMEKLNLHSTGELVRFALRSGLID